MEGLRSFEAALLDRFRLGDVVGEKEEGLYQRLVPLQRRGLVRVAYWTDGRPTYRTTEAGMDALRSARGGER